MSVHRWLYAVPEGVAPHVRMNMVSSLDGAATLHGRSGGLGDAADQDTMQALRANADVVLVGARTVAIEGYGGMQVDDEDAAWRVSAGLAPQPRIAVLSGSASVPADHSVFDDAVVRPLVITMPDAPAERIAALADVADVLPCTDLADAIARLSQSAGRRILCEGGPILFGELIQADLVDELCLTLSPRLVGGSAPRIGHGVREVERRMSLKDVRRAGDELFLRYARSDGR